MLVMSDENNVEMRRVQEKKKRFPNSSKFGAGRITFVKKGEEEKEGGGAKSAVGFSLSLSSFSM